MIFTLLTVARIRQRIVESVPPGLRFSFAAGIGLFLAFIGLNEAGLVTLGVAGAPVRMGALNSVPAMVAIFGFVAIAMLTLWRARRDPDWHSAGLGRGVRARRRQLAAPMGKRAAQSHANSFQV